MQDATSPKQQAATELIARIFDGDRAAEATLVALFSRNLLFLLKQWTGDAELAADLHQDVFRIVLERLRGRPLEEPEKFAAFLHQTAKNLLIGHRRKLARRRTDANAEAVDQFADERNHVEEVIQEEQKRLVRRLLSELSSERDRRILVRFYLHEDDKTTICRDLDLSEAHFNRVLFRARQRFRALLERSGHVAALRPSR